MFTAKKVLKAAFINARARCAKLSDDDVLYEESAPPYEADHDLLFRRAVFRRARKIWAERSQDEWYQPEDQPPQEVQDWLEGKDLLAVLEG